MYRAPFLSKHICVYRNSLSLAMMQNILENLEEDKDNQELRVIVLAAEGPVFSAGHNLKELVSRFNQHEEVKEIRIFLDI